MLEYSIPFVKSRPPVRRYYKSVTIQGMSVPMSILVDKYLSGQVVGLSSYSAYFDEDVDEDNFHNAFFPDPANPLAYEQAMLDASKFNIELRKRSIKAKQSASEPDKFGNDQNVSEAAAAT